MLVVKRSTFILKVLEFLTSDGSGLGLRPKPARPRGFLGGPSPPEARSSKPESPAGFFGPKIGQFWSRFWTEFW